MDVNKEMSKRSAAELITEDGVVIELQDEDNTRTQLSRFSCFLKKLDNLDPKDEK